MSEVIDSGDVRRVGRLDDLPDESLRCLAAGHEWGDPPAIPVTGWGPLNVCELRFRCPCGRRKVEVVEIDTGELLTRQYTGGTMLYPGTSLGRPAARVLWLARKRDRASGVARVADRRKRRTN